jgi:hypothetical protein
MELNHSIPMPYNLQLPVFWHLLHDYHFGGCSQKLTFKQSSNFQALGLMGCLYFVNVCIIHKSFVLLIMHGELKEKINITSYV